MEQNKLFTWTVVSFVQEHEFLGFPEWRSVQTVLRKTAYNEM
jgi:hypothetical protein